MSADSAQPVFTLATGPVGSTPATLAALARPVLHHTDPAFRALYAQTVQLLREAFGTGTDPVIAQGEAVVGIEAAAASLIAPGDVVLNLVSGIYGRAFGELARRYAAEVLEIETSYDRSIDPAAVRDALNARPDIAIVSAVHCDTPSGTINDLDAIGPVVAAHGALLIVDAVSTFAGSPTDFGGWPAGIAIAAPQKALGGSPGLSLLHVSDAAWRHIEGNPRAPKGSALSILDWRDAHLPGHPFPFTPSVSEIYALHSVLSQYLAEGPEAVQARHRAAARAARAGAQALGLTLWAAPGAIRSDTVTALAVPDGVDGAEVRAIARAESGVLLAGGQGGLNVLQIGHMGPAAYPLSPVIALAALGRALRKAGGKADIGAAVEAALAADQDPAAVTTGKTTGERPITRKQ
jgi:pyridoxamine---pyruvate transaminase